MATPFTMTRKQAPFTSCEHPEQWPAWLKGLHEAANSLDYATYCISEEVDRLLVAKQYHDAHDMTMLLMQLSGVLKNLEGYGQTRREEVEKATAIDEAVRRVTEQQRVHCPACGWLGFEAVICPECATANTVVGWP